MIKLFSIVALSALVLTPTININANQISTDDDIEKNLINSGMVDNWIYESGSDYFKGQLIQHEDNVKIVLQDFTTNGDYNWWNSDSLFKDNIDDSNSNSIQMIYNELQSTLDTEILPEYNIFVYEVVSSSVQNNISIEKSALDYSELLSNPLVEELDSKSSSSSISGSKKIFLNPRTAGMIFHTNTKSSYNHTGIFVNSNNYVEAIGPGYKSAKRDIKKYPQYAVSNGAVTILDLDNYSYKKTAMNNAAKWVESNAISKGYDSNFASNKSNNGYNTLNCSELVYKAYKYKSGYSIDLDSNGGLGVYPDNIYNEKAKELHVEATETS